MDIYEAIPVRRSTRRFDPTPLPPQELESVASLLAAAEPLLPGRLGLHLADGRGMARIMPGLVGPYGKIAAPHWLVATAGADDEAGYENAGFALERVVLGLTAEGIATCWVGGAARKDVFRGVVDFPDAERVVVLVAVGRAGEGRAYTPWSGTGRRRDLASSLLGAPGGWTDALEAARTAPSAGNTQPWRFLADGDRLHAYSRTVVPIQYRLGAEHLRLMNRTDVGIALAHVRVAEEHAGRTVTFAREPGREREGMTYIATAVRE